MIATHPAKVKALAMGRRWGKTVLGGCVSLATAAQGGSVAWVVPTYKNSRPLWRWAERATANLRKAGYATANKSDYVIEFPTTGGLLGIYTADNPDSILGEAFHLVVIDEAARIDEEVWTATIQPTLADVNGDALLISTPKGRNWFWREWVRGQERSAEVASWTAPSSANPNPNIQRASRLAQERVSERIFQQEWLALFVEDGGGVFRHVRRAATAEAQAVPWPTHGYVIGVDWGKLQDFTVFTVIDMTTHEVVAVERFNQIDYAAQTERLWSLYRVFRPITVIAERNSMGEPIIESLQRGGMRVTPFTTTNASKAMLIEALSLAFERQSLRILNDATLVGELEAYEAERLPGGLLRYGAPSGMHDDCVVSLGLAWWGASATQSVGMGNYRNQ